MCDILASLDEFGADPSNVRLLDDSCPELLPYAALMTARSRCPTPLGVVEGVYEWQDAPLVFLVSADSLEVNGQRQRTQLQRIRRLLAMRGDAPYLGIVAPGSLRVYRIALDKRPLSQARVRWEDGANSGSTVFARLGNERPQAAVKNSNWIFNVVLRLFSESTATITGFDVSDEDAISLVGRALFTRFLADRSLLPEDMSDLTASNSEAELFDSPETTEKTSAWLDATFNGDLLPLTTGLFRTLPSGVYRVLGNVLRRSPAGQLFLGWEEKWGNLDFAQIPIGVLSQAYELYLKEHAPAKQRTEGGYFTPRPIADLMVRASLRALQRRQRSKQARILDPAVGGGIFLLTAFRELVAEHWRVDGQRPDTDVLRRILYRQVVGFDINEAALRFTALGLYLLSIELDPSPRPVDKLRFEDLRGTVLFRVKGTEDEEGNGLGSLGPQVGEEHNGQYDVVIGNPPWAKAKGTMLAKWESVCETVKRIAANRGIEHTAPPLPNKVLDLPFLWRAMEWAKPSGQISFAMHARLLFQQGYGMPEARESLLEALDITSIVNGSELRKTKVWPQISAPFCILFASNKAPDSGAGFRFISPHIEDSLNRSGGMRIDTLNAEVLTAWQISETPESLKVLFRGSRADLGVLQRIRSQGHPTLAEFWREWIGSAGGMRLQGSGNGYQTLMPSSRTRRQGDGRPGVAATYLHGLKEISAASLEGNVLIDTNSLSFFSHERIHDPRSRDLFNGPLLLVHHSPSAPTGRLRVAISEEDIVFNESFYGYSPSTHREAGLVVRYLLLVLGSKLVSWLALITSGQFGLERDVVDKASLDRIPLPDFDKLTPQQRGDITRLVAALQSGGVSWEDVDAWIVRLYGINQRDLQVVSDTLEFNLPFSGNKERAQTAPTSSERKRFCEVLTDELQHWSDRFGSRLTVDRVPPVPMSPWQAVVVRVACRGATDIVPAVDWRGLIRAADEAAASEIIIENGQNELLVGRLAQRRYWSESQARLLAQRIAWSHVEFLKRRADG